MIDPLPNTSAILIRVNDNLVPTDLPTIPVEIQATPTAKEKLSARYQNTVIDWKSIYSLSFRTTLATIKT